MPRYELGRNVEERDTYTGTYVRHGSKPGQLLTLLLRDIKNTKGVIVTDHLWFNYTDGFRKLGWLNAGDIIRFDARVRTYQRRSGGSVDYKLSHPTKLGVIGRSN